MLQKTKILDIVDGRGRFATKIPISDNIFKEDETGFLYCKNSIVGNIGEQKYYGREIGLTDEKADEVIIMLRDEEQVFNEDSMATIEGKPVTLLHPKGKVNSKNYKKYLVGTIKDVKRDNDNLASDIVIYDEYTVEKVLNGEMKDLSLGYTAKVVPMADGRYRQEDIVVNHLSIVEEGRAENARIVDEKTVDDGADELQPQDFTDKIHETKSVTVTERTNTYDDETGEEVTEEHSSYISKHSHYEKAKQALLDNAKIEKTKEGETKVEKNFKYFITELKDLAGYPKGEFRDSAYTALADECKETLGVELPTFESLKESVVSKSVGLKDSRKDFKEEKEEEVKSLEVYAQDENRFYENLYRSMDNVETARKYAGMSFHDVYTAIAEGSKL